MTVGRLKMRLLDIGEISTDTRQNKFKSYMTLPLHIFFNWAFYLT